MTQMGALVIGGDYRGLGLVRSLGRRGVPVAVAVDDHWLAAWSRYASRRIRFPTGDAARLAALRALALDQGFAGWTIFPTADDTAAFVSRHHAELGGWFRLTTSAWEVFRVALDKRLTYALADGLGIARPATYAATTREELDQIRCAFPVVVKPALRSETDPHCPRKAWPAADRHELAVAFADASRFYEPGRLIVQELVVGRGSEQLSYAAVCARGDVIGWLNARRTRQWPVDFGHSSSFVETIDLPELAAIGERIVRAAGFDGLVEVEFKRDVRGGELKLLDINARSWGWHSIGQRAGVDFPFMAWSLSQGRPVTRARGRAGVRWVHAITDVPASIAEMRGGNLGVVEYARALAGDVELALLALDDPLPALLEIPMALSLMWRRRHARTPASYRRAVADS